MVFRNRLASVGWCFALVFVSFVGAMTYLLFSQGVPAGNSPTLFNAALIVFWVGALGFVSYAAGRPLVCVAVDANGPIRITWRYPVWTETRDVDLVDVADVAVVEARDDEDAPYFRTRLTMRDGTQVDLMESHNYDRCESVRARFESALH